MTIQFRNTSQEDSLNSTYSRVIIFSPADVVTGGPEALHQLAYMIRQSGAEAGMVYYTKSNGIEISATHIRSQVTEGVVFEAYSRYMPKPYLDINLKESDLIIFPEVMASYALINYVCKRAVWWLSVDNALSANPGMRYPRMPQSLFQNREIIHLYQSAYARQFLLERGVKKLVPLSDYTNLDDLIQKVSCPQQRSVDIALFPNKGAKLAQAFVSHASEFRYTLIQNMTRVQVGECLRSSKVYIDFGEQPGKDRVPREAAISGNVVFLHHKGAGSYYEDCPLDDVYLFTEEDVLSGNLKARVQLVLLNYMHNFRQQAYYRERILSEKEEFRMQVGVFFAQKTHEIDN